jgi:glycosyltransferase A (GT-A) superfamily protein (DUF2064 family)
VHLLVMAKAPVAGRVKTRLCPPLTWQEAADVATAALADTLAAVAACGAEHKVLALDGAPGDWLPPGFTLVPQRGASFADRLANAWKDAGPFGVQIGMDTPQVSAADLDALLGDIRPGCAVLGPALDGGWWAIGLAGTDPAAVFAGIPMSTPETGRLQAERLATLGLDVHLAPPMRDIDTVDDLRGVARTMPLTSHVARAVAA